MRTAVLVSGVVVLGLLGAGGGYLVGDLTQPTTASANGDEPTGSDSPTADYIVKTPVPNNTAAFKATGLRYREHTFTVRQEPEPTVEVSIDMPRGWQLTSSPKTPGEVKFLDPLKERGVRVESGFPPDLTTAEQRKKLIPGLTSSQAPENDLKILENYDSTVTDAQGETRNVSTLIYTFIPTETLRYVIVRWVATGGDAQATVEMSVTGLPQDAAGLKAVLAQASESVTVRDD
ncbi:hypothetical protein [Kribbella sp. DT2]|uniref:hypothetical protein n=1 Tax=Kribbella sp. DT2 TaxID=3393427 RepID=UPI003CE95F3A